MKSSRKAVVILVLVALVLTAGLFWAASVEIHAADDCASDITGESRVITLEKSGEKQRLSATGAFTEAVSLPDGLTTSVVYPDGAAIGFIGLIQWAQSLCGDWSSQPIGGPFAYIIGVGYGNNISVPYGLGVSAEVLAEGWGITQHGFEREPIWVETPTPTATPTPQPTPTPIPTATPVPLKLVYLPTIRR